MMQKPEQKGAGNRFRAVIDIPSCLNCSSIAFYESRDRYGMSVFESKNNVPNLLSHRLLRAGCDGASF